MGCFSLLMWLLSFKSEEKIPECSLICADANRLPLRSHTFDLVYCVNALHHFNDANSFINEAEIGGLYKVIPSLNCA